MNQTESIVNFFTENPLILGITLLTIGAGVSVYQFGFQLPAKTAIFGSQGEEAIGSIFEIKSEQISRSQIEYWANIRFQDQSGNEHQIHETYDFKNWLDLKDTQKPIVRYLKNSPSTAIETHSQRGEKPNIVWSLITSALFLIPGVLAILVAINENKPKEDDYDTPYRPPPSAPRPPRQPLA